MTQTNYIAHHGVKGQKWGVRKWQNVDGTLTEAGRQRLMRFAANHERKAKKDVQDYQQMGEKRLLKESMQDAKEYSELRTFLKEQKNIPMSELENQLLKNVPKKNHWHAKGWYNQELGNLFGDKYDYDSEYMKTKEAQYIRRKQRKTDFFKSLAGVSVAAIAVTPFLFA